MTKATDAQIDFPRMLDLRLRGAQLRLLVLLLIVAMAGTCSPRRDTLNQVKQTGILRIVSVNGPTTWYLDATDEPAGFEYDLAADFATSLGARPQVLIAESRTEALRMLRSGAADLATAGITVTPSRKNHFELGPPLRSVTPQLVYLLGRRRPRSLQELDGSLHLADQGASIEWLQSLPGQSLPQWMSRNDADQETLLLEVASGDIDFTIADSDLVSITRRYHPELRVAFSPRDSQPVVWAMRKNEDPKFVEAVNQFVESHRAEGQLARVHDRYFGHVNRLNYVGTRTFARHVQTRLPRLQGAFQAASAKYSFDWRLLAAVGYQESHWNEDAKSPTGVRGIMMLTRATAKQLGVADRTDPLQSIFGGSRYLRKMHDSMPDSIPEPDRTWMALSAYNIGLGHLRDARKLTKNTGGDPDSWIDVREILPRLAQKKWYKQTAYGYARGHEAVTYVGNIRGYFDILTWISDTDEQQFPKGEPDPTIETQPQGIHPILKRDNPLL